jgi:hypothetical protein
VAAKTPVKCVRHGAADRHIPGAVPQSGAQFDSGGASGDRVIHMVQKPIAKEVAHRFAALVGRGLTQHEAARAVGIGTRTGERLMTKPEIRQIVEQTRAARPELVGEPYETISALLKATDADGNPDLGEAPGGRGAGVEPTRRRERRQGDPPRGRVRRLPDAGVASSRYTRRLARDVLLPRRACRICRDVAEGRR